MLRTHCSPRYTVPQGRSAQRAGPNIKPGDEDIFLGTNELSRSASRTAASWRHADLTDTHGMPRRSGGTLPSRPSTDRTGSPSQPPHHPHTPGYNHFTSSDNHRRIIGFEAPSSLPNLVPQHTCSPAGRGSHSSSILAAVADHLNRLDPTRPTSARTTVEPVPERHPTPPPLTPGGSSAAVREAADYGSVVQQARLPHCRSTVFMPTRHTSGCACMRFLAAFSNRRVAQDGKAVHDPTQTCARV